MRFIFILFPFFILSQTSKPLESVFCDCATARTVVLKNNTKIGPTVAPIGYGQTNEIGEQIQKTKFIFEKEHNSAWYKLVIKTDGNLVFDIIPVKPEDDYDFILFKGNEKGFCDSLQQFHIKPIRACISRDNKEIKGFTGLRFKSKKELIKEGVGDAFATPIEVKTGETYYLVLDNVYENGAGHSIGFYFEELVSINGETKNENNTPIIAEITVTGPNGDTLKKLITDKKGKYTFDVSLKKNVTYSLNFYNDSSFFLTKQITTKTPKDTLKQITTVLPTLKKGNKYIIQNINFYPAQPTLLPSAYPSLKNLNKLMHKNPNLKILIVGHTNGCDGHTKKQTDDLSRNRALTVKKYLELNSIAADRSAVDGKGCSEMLYELGPNTPEWQQVLNRRVEIFVTEK